MSYFLSEEQELIRDTARRFAQSELDPVANQIDREDSVPDALHHKAAELNFFGLFTPEPYGGMGQNLTSVCLVLEEIAKASPSYAGVISVEIILCPAALAIAGTEEQKRRYLIPSARGERLMAWSQTEPAGGGNAPYHLTRITPDGNGYRLNGLKLFCTQGRAETILVMGKTSHEGTTGYGCVLVDKSMPGVEPAPYEAKLGWRGTNTGTIGYNNVFIPPENVLGDLITGAADLWQANVPSFIGHAATSLGCAQGLFDKTVAFVKERNLYSRPMYNCQPVSYWLAECYAKLEAMRSLLYTTARRWDAKLPDPVMSTVCKAWICDTAFDVTHRLLQLWGGSGIMDSTGVNRYMRDARTNMVAEGASEMHYDMISAHVLGKPTVMAGG